MLLAADVLSTAADLLAMMIAQLVPAASGSHSTIPAFHMQLQLLQGHKDLLCQSCQSRAFIAIRPTADGHTIRGDVPVVSLEASVRLSPAQNMHSLADSNSAGSRSITDRC